VIGDVLSEDDMTTEQIIVANVERIRRENQIPLKAVAKAIEMNTAHLRWRISGKWPWKPGMLNDFTSAINKLVEQRENKET